MRTDRIREFFAWVTVAAVVLTIAFFGAVTVVFLLFREAVRVIRGAR